MQARIGGGILGDRENAAWIFAKANPDMFVSLPG
jgi:hypothetical protein